jgi:aromatic aminotransferase
VRLAHLVGLWQITYYMHAGIVYWTPPAAALEAVAAAASDPELSQYGPDAGLPALRQALTAKLAAENGIHQVGVTTFVR